MLNPHYELKVSITDPQKQNDNYGGYMTYRVVTQTNHPAFSNSEYSVVRRFNDFSWLHDQLGYFNPGCIIPPLPDKQTVGRFSPEFVESRRRALEKFIIKCANHADICNTPCFQQFLKVDPVELEQIKTSYQKEKEKNSKGAISWLESKVNSLTTNSQNNIERTAADLKFEEVLQYITHLETQMSAVAKHTTTLVKRNREMANAMFEFGQSFTWLGQSEGDSLGAALTQMGNAADRVSVLANESAENELIQFEEPIYEYVRLLGSVKAAMQRRADKKKAFLAATADLEAKQISYNKVVGVVGKEAQAQEKSYAVEKAQSAVDAAKDEYEKVSEKLLEEFERFKTEKTINIKAIMLSFVNLQIEFHKKSEIIWKELTPALTEVSQNTLLPASYNAGKIQGMIYGAVESLSGGISQAYNQTTGNYDDEDTMAV